ncbi:MAG: T9SS C-terminal target domain-containing protein [Bacteroidetes bacterium]|nr:MAG: T9SS C-terminal target domain-containing protein [Bacteroidota bacterium]
MYRSECLKRRRSPRAPTLFLAPSRRHRILPVHMAPDSGALLPSSRRIFSTLCTARLTFRLLLMKKMSTVLRLLSLLLLPLPSVAQGLQVVSSIPEPGNAGVALEDTVIFEFNQILNLNTSSWNTAVVFPRSALSIQSAEACVAPDRCIAGDEPRFIRYVVTHNADVDYTWIYFFARSSDGHVLSEPYVLTYTTAATISPHRVSGVLSSGTPASLHAGNRSLLRHLARSMQDNGLGVPVFAADSMKAAKAFPSSHALQGEGAHTRVLLLDDFWLDERFWDIRYATATLSDSGPFEIRHVRDGTYWPLAVRYTDASSTEIEALGFYDADADGEPDPITVSGGHVSGVDLTLVPFTLSDARTHVDEAYTEAAAVVDDPSLYIIYSISGARPSGEAYTWGYRFLSGTTGEMVTVVIDPLGPTIDTTQLLSLIEEGMSPIPGDFIDSRTALEIYKTHGGADFLAPFRPNNLTTTIQGGNFRSRTKDHKDRVFWWIDVVARTGSRTEALTQRIDMTTGEVLVDTDDSPTAIQPSEQPQIHQLGRSYPNPFTTHTTIPFVLNRAAPVRLEVFDLLGRRIDVLIDQVLPPGSHEATWHALDQPAGLYYYRLSVDQEPALNRPMIRR